MSLAALRGLPLLVLAALALLLLVAGLGLASGPLPLSAAQLWQGLTTPAGADPAVVLVVQELRLPRLVLGLLVGAALAMAGVALQGLFRNPLADPGLIGVSSGAALGAVALIVLGDSLLQGWRVGLGALALPLAAFAGGLVAALLAWRLARRSGSTEASILLLGGIAINALAGAGTGLLTYLADDSELRSLTFWSMGSLAYAGWADVRLAAPWLLAGIVLLPLLARPLNAFLLGEAVAGHLGYSTEQVKRALLALSALAVGAAVAVTGLIGFVGLVVPHLMRGLVGADHRLLFPFAGLLGAILLVAADTLCRLLVSPAELPIGLVMALLGGPFFLLLLQRRPVA